MSKNILFEYMPFAKANAEVLEEGNQFGGKDLYMKGIFIQGDVRNHNQRIYPAREISRAVNEMSRKISSDEGSLQGQLDHPEDLGISLDRVSHLITDMWMVGNDGYGKLKILPTPMGNIAKALLQSGVKLGVSSRGSGNVGDDGIVSDFEIVTVDIVAQPSAPSAYPKVIYESLYNMKGGARIVETARTAHTDQSAAKQIQRDLVRFMKELKI